MMRPMVMLGALAVCAVALWLWAPQKAMLIATDAVATPMAGGNGAMLTVKITNDGDADVLTDVSVTGAVRADLVGATGALAIPGDGAGTLAMDGAHVMARMENNAWQDGGFLPLTLQFASGAKVATRARIETGMVMDHSLAGGQVAQPAPGLEIALQHIGARKVAITVSVQNFRFVLKDGMAAHVDGEGHAHVYLNGLKLARLYSSEFETGALPPGKYALRVSLNTNDHRPYLDGGQPVSRTLAFVIE